MLLSKKIQILFVILVLSSISVFLIKHLDRDDSGTTPIAQSEISKRQLVEPHQINVNQSNTEPSIDLFRDDPDSFYHNLRINYRNEKLREKILEFAALLIKSGNLDDLHALMLVCDNPAITQELSFLMISDTIRLAGHNITPEKLIAFSSAWSEQPDGRNIQKILLQKAGQLGGSSVLPQLLGKFDDSISSEILVSTAYGAIKSDATGVKNWLNSPQSGSLAPRQRIHVYQELVRELPIGSLVDDISTMSFPEEDLDSAALGVLERAAIYKEPQEVAEYLGSASNLGEKVKNGAARKLAVGWGGKDLLAASEWVNSLSVGSMRDNAIFGLLNAMNNHRLNKAEYHPWIDSISDPSMREQVSRMYSIEK